jgi:tubulin-specific chaperone D
LHLQQIGTFYLHLVQQQRPVADSLVKFALALPLVEDQTSTYSVSELVVDLIDLAKSNMTSNAIVVPVFRTFNVLLEADVLRQLPNEVTGLPR